MLRRQNAPRRFALSFESSDPPAIRISIWEPCVERLAALFGIHKRVPEYLRHWKFTSFMPGLREGFGFDNAMQAIGVEDGYLVLRAPLGPKVYPTAISFGLLLGLLKFYPDFVKTEYNEEAPADSRKWQLMELDSYVTADSVWHSAPLGGVAAPILVDWVERMYQENRRFSAVEEAMWRAWNAMATFKIEQEAGPYPYPGFAYRLGEQGSFVLSTIGNACDISTEDWWRRQEGEGHKLGCHNLDTPIQQLSLLAGLAALHEIAATEIDSRPPV